jgi:hypothetical protein
VRLRRALNASLRKPVDKANNYSNRAIIAAIQKSWKGARFRLLGLGRRRLSDAVGLPRLPYDDQGVTALGHKWVQVSPS